MQWWPILPVQQSNLVSCASLLSAKNYVVEALCSCAIVLYYALLRQPFFVISCELTYAYCYLFPVMHVTKDTKKGEALPAYHSHDGFPVAAFLAYHRRISIWPHLGLSILTSIRQPPIAFHAYICLFSIAFLLLMMISWFHHFFRYELLSNVGLAHCLFFFLHIKFCNGSNSCFPCNKFIFVGFWYIYCSLVLVNLFSAAPVYIYWYAISVSVASTDMCIIESMLLYSVTLGQKQDSVSIWFVNLRM